MSIELPQIRTAEYFSAEVTVAHGNRAAAQIGDLERYKTALSDGSMMETEVPPVVLYANALGAARQVSRQTKGNAAQMEAARDLSDRLGRVADVLGLPSGHFSIDLSGDPLVVRENGGEHVILPTHFEAGAYFSHPHADHHLGRTAEQLPSLQIGRYVHLGCGVGINAGGNVKLGDGVWIAPESYVLMQDHSGYERPSIGSRSVNSTDLPGVEFGDYAMVGRKSMVKWTVGYVGKGAVVALLSSVGREVGDYSIVGNGDRILGYQPSRAALLEIGRASLEETLMIQRGGYAQLKSDWARRCQEYLANCGDQAPLPEVVGLIEELAGSRATMLDMNPDIGNNLLAASLKDVSATGVAPTREVFPVILQRVEGSRTRNVRLRGDVQPDALPYATGGYDPLRSKRVGFSLVVNVGQRPDGNETNICRELDEAARVTAPGGKIVIGVKDGDTVPVAKYGMSQLGLNLERETTQQDGNGQRHHLVIFSK